jgi:uncharacterized protein YdeI (YjbR/CyaY-like superfamily)
MNPKVDEYFSKITKWRDELQQLRNILLNPVAKGFELTEELKWGVPCYTFQKSNLFMLGGFKENCVLSFIKGALLKDKHNILIQQTENSQSVRIMRFKNISEILEIESIIKAYIYEAIEAEKAGLKVELKKSTDLILPDELIKMLNNNPAFKTAFEALPLGKQRGYNLYFTAATQSKTRESRILNYMPRILDGKGFHDCVCGLSKKMPTCDGSHKYIEKK